MIKDLQSNDSYVHITFDDCTAKFHYFWLKHNCQTVGKSLHPKTLERIVDASEIPLDTKPQSMQIVQTNEVHIAWSSDHHSVYTEQFLRDNMYAKNHFTHGPPPSDNAHVVLDFAQFLDSNKQLQVGKYTQALHERVTKFGVVVVRNRGMDTEQVINDLIPQGCKVIETHFGRIEDLRTDNTTNKNTDQLGYTDAAVCLHTDQPFIANPPGMQALHCMEPAAIGGESTIVDAKRAALYLKEIDPMAYHLLRTIPVRFHRKQKQFESLQVCPIIIENEQHEIVQLRYSYFTYAPHVVDFELMPHFYAAYNKFADLVRNPKHQYQFKLQSGDFVLYNNHVMFHARTSFQGKRWLRGVYFDIEHVHNHLSQYNQ